MGDQGMKNIKTATLLNDDPITLEALLEKARYTTLFALAWLLREG